MNYSKIILEKPGGPILDFSKERNKLLKEAKTEWVLFVDTDEKITPELDREILDAARMTENEGYYVKRTDYFFGNWLKFGETGNIKLVRLGKKDAGKWVGKVHETWEIGNCGQLKNPLLHYPHKSLHAFIEKINYYTEIIERKKFSLFKLLFFPTGKFIQNYFLRLGFLDGMPGFIMAFMMSLHSLVVRVKDYDFSKTS